MSDSPNSPPAGPRIPPAVLAAGLGLGVALVQLVLACSLSGRANISESYRALYQWDSIHYGNIAVGGYVCPPQLTHESHGNVSWFPGFPLSIWLLRAAAGWPKEVATLAAAQLACWGFWTYVFLLFQRWRIPIRLSALGFLLLVSRPSAFFLVAAYSEPLFLMSLLGFVYWSVREIRAAPVLAALHGLVLTATRISGLPVVVYPVLYAWLNQPREAGSRRNAARLATALAVAAFAALGAGLFFLYCQIHFGCWDLYMKTQLLGWGVRRTTSPFSTGTPISSAFRFGSMGTSTRAGSVAFPPRPFCRPSPASSWRKSCGCARPRTRGGGSGPGFTSPPGWSTTYP